MDANETTDPTASRNPGEPDGWAAIAEQVDEYVDDLTEVRFATEMREAEQRVIAEAQAAQVNAVSWSRRTWRRLMRFLRRNEIEFDDIYARVVASADETDRLVDLLMEMGHRKKSDIESQMAALTRQQGQLNSEMDRMLGLGEQSQQLQAAIRSAPR